MANDLIRFVRARIDDDVREYGNTRAIGLMRRIVDAYERQAILVRKQQQSDVVRLAAGSLTRGDQAAGLEHAVLALAAAWRTHPDFRANPRDWWRGDT